MVLLGLLCGSLIGFVIHEVVARIVLAANDGLMPDSLALARLLGYVTPLLAVAGLFAALRIDRRRRSTADRR